MRAFAGSVAGDRGGFSASQSKPWRQAENSYTLLRLPQLQMIDLWVASIGTPLDICPSLLLWY